MLETAPDPLGSVSSLGGICLRAKEGLGEDHRAQAALIAPPYSSPFPVAAQPSHLLASTFCSDLLSSCVTEMGFEEPSGWFALNFPS